MFLIRMNRYLIIKYKQFLITRYKKNSERDLCQTTDLYPMMMFLKIYVKEELYRYLLIRDRDRCVLLLRYNVIIRYIKLSNFIITSCCDLKYYNMK